MLIRMFKYFFPRILNREKLPPLPTYISSDVHPYKPLTDPVSLHKIKMLMGHGVARTDADAHRLLYKHVGKDVKHIIHHEKPKSRKLGRFQRAWQRLKRIW